MGYQKGLTLAFYSTKYDTKSINDHYVDGISLTLGNPRKHVWTYAIGLSNNSNYPNYNCPCATTSGPDPPTFVGNHYYCEAGNTGGAGSGSHYTHDPLWDGSGCGVTNNCCANPDGPWFFRQFALPVQAYLEARIYHRESFSRQDALVESIELYVQ